MVLNEFRGIVYDEWFKTAEIPKNVELNTDEFMVMMASCPNNLFLKTH